MKMVQGNMGFRVNREKQIWQELLSPFLKNQGNGNILLDIQLSDDEVQEAEEQQ